MSVFCFLRGEGAYHEHSIMATKAKTIAEAMCEGFRY